MVRLFSSKHWYIVGSTQTTYCDVGRHPFSTQDATVPPILHLARCVFDQSSDSGHVIQTKSMVREMNQLICLLLWRRDVLSLSWGWVLVFAWGMRVTITLACCIVSQMMRISILHRDRRYGRLVLLLVPPPAHPSYPELTCIAFQPELFFFFFFQAARAIIIFILGVLCLGPAHFNFPPIIPQIH